MNSVSAYRSAQKDVPEVAKDIFFTPALKGPRGTAWACEHVIYVTVIPWVGIYLSSFFLIGLFMVWLGNYRIWYAFTLSAAIMVATYLTFEKWFLVPLPKGPIEEFLGL